MALLIGTVVRDGRYRIEEFVNEGDTSNLYVVSDLLNPDVRYSLEELTIPEDEDAVTLKESFVQNALQAMEQGVDGSRKIYDVFEESGCAYCLMELLSDTESEVVSDLVELVDTIVDSGSVSIPISPVGFTSYPQTSVESAAESHSQEVQVAGIGQDETLEPMQTIKPYVISDESSDDSSEETAEDAVEQTDEVVKEVLEPEVETVEDAVEPETEAETEAGPELGADVEPEAVEVVTDPADDEVAENAEVAEAAEVSEDAEEGAVVLESEENAEEQTDEVVEEVVEQEVETVEDAVEQESEDNSEQEMETEQDPVPVPEPIVVGPVPNPYANPTNVDSQTSTDSESSEQKKTEKRHKEKRGYGCLIIIIILLMMLAIGLMAFMYWGPMSGRIIYVQTGENTSQVSPGDTSKQVNAGSDSVEYKKLTDTINTTSSNSNPSPKPSQGGTSNSTGTSTPKDDGKTWVYVKFISHKDNEIQLPTLKLEYIVKNGISADDVVFTDSNDEAEVFVEVYADVQRVIHEDYYAVWINYDCSIKNGDGELWANSYVECQGASILSMDEAVLESGKTMLHDVINKFVSIN